MLKLERLMDAQFWSAPSYPGVVLGFGQAQVCMTLGVCPN
jgi:hypothetical protein